MSNVAFVVIAVFTLAAAVAAATNPKLMHAALSFAVAFVGVAALYVWLGAEFVGLIQVFVYIGAVVVLVLFTILLTRREGEKLRGFNWSGVVIALVVFAALVWSILKTPALSISRPQAELLTVKRIGDVLMSEYVWPLMGVGVLLTVALLGALILAMDDKRQ